MERRRFLAYLCGAPLVSYATVVLSGCSDDQGQSALSGRSALTDAPGSLQSFGYYEGLAPTETRDPGRTDGTNYNMPCILAADIQAGNDKQYVFWHGHDGSNHLFTVTAAHFQALQQGQKVEIFTSVVEGHRHSLLISPTSRCQNAC